MRPIFRDPTGGEGASAEEGHGGGGGERTGGQGLCSSTHKVKPNCIFFCLYYRVIIYE